MSKEITENICEEVVFGRVYEKYAKDLHDFLYYKYGAQYHPEDKAQEAFVKLWDNCKTVSWSKAKSFLFTVANNLMLNAIKHQKVVLKYQQQPRQQHTNQTPEFLMEENEFMERYKTVLERLPEEQRTAFLLSKAEGKKHAEIAEMMGITQKAVEYRIYSAFKTLKTELKGFKLK